MLPVSTMDCQMCHNDKYLFTILKPSNVGLISVSLLLLIVTMACHIYMHLSGYRFKKLKFIMDYVNFVFFNVVPTETDKEIFKNLADFYQSQKIDFPADGNTIQRIRASACSYDLIDLVETIDLHLYNFQYVKLNVGGKKYELERVKIPGNSTLSELTNLDRKPDADGNIIIERDGSVFAFVLQYLCDGKVDFPNDLSVVKAVGKEAKYYGLTKLFNLVKLEIKNITLSNSFVKLNVGGTKFNVAKSTLCGTDSMLKRMVESPISTELDEDDYILIDRDGSVFEYVVQYLRDAKVDFPNDESRVERILTEANYYNCQGLINACTTHLNNLLKIKEDKNNLVTYRRAVYTIDERNTLIAGEESIVFLCLGGFKNSTFGTSNTQLCVASALVHFLRMPARYPKFIYCIDYTDSVDLSFDFYTHAKHVKHLVVYSRSIGSLDNIGEQIDRAVQLVMSDLLYIQGYGRFVENNTNLSIMF